MSTPGENFYQRVVAIYNELTNLLIKVVSRHALEHPHAGSVTDPNISISNIFSRNIPALREIKSTTWEENVNLLFTSSDRKFLKSSIDISKLDCSLLFDIMLRFPGFPDIYAKGPHTHASCAHTSKSCCGKCDHSSSSCKQKNCSTRCNHNCKHCGKSKTECNDYIRMCNGNCCICLQCNEKGFVEIINKVSKSTKITCPAFVYHSCLKHMLKFRNLYGHSAAKDFESFPKGMSVINIGSFSLKTEPELKEFIVTVFECIWNHLTDAKQMTTPFSTAEEKKFLEKINIIFNFQFSGIYSKEWPIKLLFYYLNEIFLYAIELSKCSYYNLTSNIV